MEKAILKTVNGFIDTTDFDIKNEISKFIQSINNLKNVSEKCKKINDKIKIFVNSVCPNITDETKRFIDSINLKSECEKSFHSGVAETCIQTYEIINCKTMYGDIYIEVRYFENYGIVDFTFECFGTKYYVGASQKDAYNYKYDYGKCPEFITKKLTCTDNEKKQIIKIVLFMINYILDTKLIAFWVANFFKIIRRSFVKSYLDLGGKLKDVRKILYIKEDNGYDEYGKEDPNYNSDVDFDSDEEEEEEEEK